MKVLGLVGSPRKGSNTDLLLEAVLKGAETSGSNTEKIYLYNFDIKPCLDCRACKRSSFQCIEKDGMQTLYPKFEAADVIVFGTPLYWYGPSAKMKLLIDRLRPFILSEKMKNKKAVLVVPSEEGAEACDLIVEMFERSFRYLKIEMAGKILPKASERGEVKKQPEVLAAAVNLGKSLK